LGQFGPKTAPGQLTFQFSFVDQWCHGETSGSRDTFVPDQDSRYFYLFYDATADEKGNFVLENCIPGTWSLGFYSRTRKTFPDSSFDLKLDIPRKKEVHLDIGKNSKTILGKIQFIDKPNLKIEKDDIYLSIIQTSIKLPEAENSVTKLEAKYSTYLESDGSFGVDQVLPYESEFHIHLMDPEGDDHRSQPFKFIPRNTPEGYIYLEEIKVKLTDEYLDWD